ncbi:SH3 domain-containing protein [Brucella intermedia]|uniref:SH3 domain-containing protein n=1 Tax=Brucella intermedia TaxID=94625 RepID=UPI002248C41C|nr:SH3 domain-containing protein [Brucella intermedia]
MSLFKRVLNKNHVIGAAVAAVVLITPAVAFAATAYVSAAVNIRSGPGANYARLAALPAGAAVNAGSCRNGWCQVYNGNGTGWVSARYIRFGSYGGQAYAAPSTTTVVVDNGYYDGWAPGFGAGLGVGWATGGYWGPGYWGRGWRGGPNYYNGCIGRNCQSWRGGHNRWDPRWGVGPAWRTGHAGHYWGPGPLRPRFNAGGFNRPGFNRPGFNRPAFNHGFGGFGGGHFGNVRPMHAGR